MAMHDVAAAIERACKVLQRRPGLGLSPDTEAACSATWMAIASAMDRSGVFVTDVEVR